MFTENIEIYCENAAEILSDARHASDDTKKEVIRLLMNMCKYSYIKGVSTGLQVVSNMSSDETDQ